MSAAKPTTQSPRRVAAPLRQLTLFDSTSIIVGIIVGSSIYESSPLIANGAAGPVSLLGIWILGGLISLVGALCYSEMGAAYPQEGGDYVYLTRAFGRPLGFLFAWCQLWVVRPGSIGAMAFVFARYANELFPLRIAPPLNLMTYALAALAVVTLINILGVREGKWTQNLLTTVKVLGLIVVVAVGLAFGHAAPSAAQAAGAETSHSANLAAFYLAMIMIMYAFGGWNEMAYVAGEVRNPEKNIVRALVLGTLGVTAIYALATYAFVHALGLEGTRNSHAVAADLLRVVGPSGAKGISLLICISALGACHGLVFTGSRIYSAMGNDHRLYAWLADWSPRFGTPVRSLVIQGLITAPLIVAFGLTPGGFEKTVVFTLPVFWGFFLLVGVSLFVLRYREPNTRRPYRVPGYPITPLLFCLSSAFMLWASMNYACQTRSMEALWSIALLAAGVVAMIASIALERRARTDR